MLSSLSSKSKSGKINYKILFINNLHYRLQFICLIHFRLFRTYRRPKKSPRKSTKLCFSYGKTINYVSNRSSGILVTSVPCKQSMYL